MTQDNFISYVNTLRKQNGDNWYMGIASVITDKNESKTIRFKGHRTWLQVLDVDGVRYPCPMDISVKQFNEVLQGIFI